VPAPFSTVDMADFEAEGVASLTDLCTIERVTGQASDSQGGTIDTWGNQSSNVACRLRPMGEDGPESVIADRLTGAELWTILLPQGTDVTIRDRVLITSIRSVAVSRRFEIKAVPGRHTYSVLVSLSCVELLPS
jgi:hypothetical protein